MAEDVKWIKLKVGMFDGESLKNIKRAKIDGELCRDKLTAIWFELMDFAGRCNHAGAFINSRGIPYETLEGIATQIDRETEELELCMPFYIDEGMVEIIDGVYVLANWAMYQNEARLQEIREKRNTKQAKWRAKQKAALLAAGDGEPGDPPDGLPDGLPNGLPDGLPPAPKPAPVKEDFTETYKAVVSYLNEKAGTKYRHTSSKTQTAIHARLVDGFSLDDFKTVIDKKSKEWIGTEFEKYLRPETLFGPKFEGYLNGKQTERTGSNANAQNNGNTGSARRYGNYI